jgi:hypothetical protein
MFNWMSRGTRSENPHAANVRELQETFEKFAQAIPSETICQVQTATVAMRAAAEGAISSEESRTAALTSQLEQAVVGALLNAREHLSHLPTGASLEQLVTKHVAALVQDLSKSPPPKTVFTPPQEILLKAICLNPALHTTFSSLHSKVHYVGARDHLPEGVSKEIRVERQAGILACICEAIQAKHSNETAPQFAAFMAALEKRAYLDV